MIKIRKNKRKVPILSDKEIDVFVEKLLCEYNPKILSEPQELDIEDFAELYMNFNVHYTHLSHSGFIWGKMVFQNSFIFDYKPETGKADLEPVKANTIVIENRLLNIEHAFRSTVAHEAGHGILHRDYYFLNYNPRQILFSFSDSDSESESDYECSNSSVCSTFCRDYDVSGGIEKPRQFKTDIDWIEHQAKYFSAALLMPRSAVFTLLDDYGADAPHEDKAFVKEVAGIFNVSNESARIRLQSMNNAYLERQAVSAANLFSLSD